MKVPHLLPCFVLLTFLGSTQSFSQHITSPAKTLANEEINQTLHKEFGEKVQAQIDMRPAYLTGDFNGDGFDDLAVAVNVEEGRAELKNHGVKYVDIDPYSKSNGTERDPVAAMGHNCLGVAVLHGGVKGWGAPTGKFLFYECFSGLKLNKRKQPVQRGKNSAGPVPMLRGDAMALDLESGAITLIYWNGKTYRGFGLRSGD